MPIIMSPRFVLPAVRFAPALTLLSAALALSACGGGDNYAAPPAYNPPPATGSASTTVTGSVVKGPVAGAQVCGYTVTANARGAALGSCVTSTAGGNYTLTLPAGSGPLWVEATGGTYTDEITSTITSLPAGSGLRAIVTANGGSVTTMLTPLTTLALNAAVTLAGSGGTLDSATFSAAAAALISSFKLPADLNLGSTAPVFGPGINSYGTALTAISKMVANGQTTGQTTGLTLAAILAAQPAALAAAYAIAATPATGAVPVVPAVGSQAFTATGSLLAARNSHAALLLPTGKVLVTGGFGANSLALATAELYDPATALWTAASPMQTARSSPTATLLPNGKVLVSGGQTSLVLPTSIASAELYDPGTNTWASAGSLATARSVHTATLLPSGKVLVVGGLNTAANANNLAVSELYDPATNAWTPTGAMTTARYAHTATLLPDGRVLVAGGLSATVGVTASVEVYNPATNSWTTVNPMATTRYLHTATLLANGKLLVMGGSAFANGVFATFKTAELYDPVANSWATAAPMAVARSSHTVTLLSGDKVLVSGGFSALNTGEIYDVAANAWTSTGLMGAGRHAHSATLLGNGKVLISGGVGSQPAGAELF